MQGKVIAVSKSATHSLSKYNQESIKLIPDWGVEGDAHAGKTVQHLYLVRTDPTRRNNRHLHLFLQEMLDELAEKSFDLTPGQVGENLTTQGLPLMDMPVGTKLYIGDEVCLELTGLRDPCGQLNGIYPGLKAAMLDKDEQGNTIYRGGLYGVIRTGGVVKPGDTLRVELPPEPHVAMTII